MTRGRRALLRGVGAGLAGLTGGCLARGSNVRYPSVETSTDRHTEAGTADDRDGATDGGDAAGDGSTEGSPTDAPPETDAAPDPANPALAERTRRVADELRWFAETYPEAIAEFRTAMRRSTRATRDLKDAGTVGVADVDELAATYDDAFERARDALDGRFRVVDGIEDRVEYHLAVVRKFAGRGDRDRTDEELGRLAAFAGGFATDVYADRSLSRNPIENRLTAFLRADEYDPERTLLWQLARTSAGGERFEAYAYRAERGDLLRPPVTDGDSRAMADWYGPLHEPADRTAAATLSVHEVDRSGGRPFPTRRPEATPTRTVVLQRYADERAAARALSEVASRVTREGEYAMGDGTWRRVYYRRAGDVAYALCCRAGEFLLATGAGETAWEERVDWDRVHRRTWLSGVGA
ncbi:hypothetical protein [Halorarum salinum]|uniref:Uncharacterized protein n=1 Tax=Halorarum salinum TaxID=2743089 RepID=A0A7D5QHK8_9EURY|nr:hypothetical protein [Halobaculum salinum]QLG62304.1 hypothetical protein HUG12_11430 [Halobaculum salinum]